MNKQLRKSIVTQGSSYSETAQRIQNRQEVDNLARSICSFTSHLKDVQEDFCVELCQQHRTHQHSVMRLFMRFVDKLAENPTDMRNEAAVELAQKIKEQFSDPYLPYI